MVTQKTNLPLLSVGIDLEDLARWRTGGLRILDPDSRIFSAAERAYCDAQADPIPHYAARWCAKEAVVKALAPLGHWQVTQIEVVVAADQPGGPSVAWRNIKKPAGLLTLSLSLTHSASTAAAVAVAQYWAGAKLATSVK